MATLHIVNKSPALASCLQTAALEDTILLIEDAVYQASVPTERKLLALTDDVDARGLKARVRRNVSVVDYDEFVNLVTTHQPIVSWR
jgi:sulfur relay protein TusB/DsrH